MINDMTEGSPSKILLNFAAPMILSGVFQQFYNIVDSVVAGRFIGINALAAVGASYPINMLFISIAMGSGIGCSVVISQFFGAKRFDQMKTAVATSIISVLILSLIMLFGGMLLSGWLLNLLNTPANIFNDSLIYLEIYIYGVIFLFIYNVATSIFNGLGDSKTSLYFLIFSSVLNIILDLVFVINFKMGVAGVAWATFIAQGIASVLSITILLKRIIKIKTEDKLRYFDKSILMHMTKIALPSIAQMSFISVGQLCIQSLVNSFGATVIAGYAAAIKIDSFFKVVIQTMGNAVSSFTAQNFGAAKFDRIRAGYVSGIKVMGIYSILSIIIIFIFGRSLIGVFVGDGGAEVIDVGVRYMYIVSVFYIVFCIMLVGNGVLRGVGEMKAFTFSTFTDLVIRVGLSFLLAHFIGYNSIWWSISIGWCVGTFITTFFYKRKKWENLSCGS